MKVLYSPVDEWNFWEQFANNVVSETARLLTSHLQGYRDPDGKTQCGSDDHHSAENGQKCSTSTFQHKTYPSSFSFNTTHAHTDKNTARTKSISRPTRKVSWNGGLCNWNKRKLAAQLGWAVSGECRAGWNQLPKICSSYGRVHKWRPLCVDLISLTRGGGGGPRGREIKGIGEHATKRQISGFVAFTSDKSCAALDACAPLTPQNRSTPSFLSWILDGHTKQHSCHGLTACLTHTGPAAPRSCRE